jgi:hypothetical protein
VKLRFCLLSLTAVLVAHVGPGAGAAGADEVALTREAQAAITPARALQWCSCTNRRISFQLLDQVAVLRVSGRHAQR